MYILERGPSEISRGRNDGTGTSTSPSTAAALPVSISTPCLRRLEAMPARSRREDNSDSAIARARELGKVCGSFGLNSTGTRYTEVAWYVARKMCCVRPRISAWRSARSHDFQVAFLTSLSDLKVFCPRLSYKTSIIHVFPR